MLFDCFDCHSEIVARKVKKNHRYIMEVIEKSNDGSEFFCENYKLSLYESGQGKKLKRYSMTRNGYIFLMLSLSGDIAKEFKKSFVLDFGRIYKMLEKSQGIMIEEIECNNKVKSCSDVEFSDKAILDRLIASVDKVAETKRNYKTYFIRYGEEVKIGKSEDPRKRLSNLLLPKSAEILGFLDFDIEAELHRKFKKYRTQGEWYRYEGLKEFISNALSKNS